MTRLADPSADILEGDPSRLTGIDPDDLGGEVRAMGTGGLGSSPQRHD